MGTKRMRKMIPVVLLAAILAGGQDPSLVAAGEVTAPPAGGENGQVYQGKINGLSKKAKTLAIEVGPAEQTKTMMVKYDEQTKGLEFAKEGEGAIVEFEQRGSDKVATLIKPKLAKLPAGVTELQVEELAAMVAMGPERGRYFLVDSRPAGAFAAGSIPSAISIPLPKLTKEAASLLPADKEFPLVFFCGGITCGLSPTSAGIAKDMGYSNVRVMLQGVPGWKKAGRALVASDEFVEKGNIVLLDLRPAAEVAAGHLARAVNIPLAGLEEAKDAIPRKAPVVLYGNGEEAEKGAAMVSKWGQKSVALVNGGLAGWQAAGHPLEKGEAPTTVTWVRKLGKNEVALDEFQKVAAAPAVEQVILDVRGKDEVAAGKLTHSLAIPLEQLEARLAELPKEKEILTHCSTGARAEMATEALLKGGFKSRFLVANVECEAVGDCDLSE